MSNAILTTITFTCDWFFIMGIFSIKIIMIMFAVQFINTAILPTIFWNPLNPIFSCEDPVINVTSADILLAYCPHRRIVPKITPLGVKWISENVHVVSNEQNYRNCDARGGKLLLRCPQPNRRKRRYYNAYKFVNLTSELDFQQGKTYYLIGTGFRNMQNIDKKTDGSCKRISKSNEYKMRIKIYVCSNADIASGNCKRCLTDSCYYKGCKAETTKWIADTTKIYQDRKQNCYVVEKQESKDLLTGSKSVRMKQIHISCPSSSCTSWISNENKQIYYDNAAYREQTRNCTSKITGIEKLETRLFKLDKRDKVCLQTKIEKEKVYSIKGECYLPTFQPCYYPWINLTITEHSDKKIPCKDIVPPNVEGIVASKSQKQEDKDKDLHTIITIFSSIISFIIGIIFGVTCLKFYYKKKYPKTKSIQGNRSSFIAGSIPDILSDINSPIYVVDTVAIDGNDFIDKQNAAENGKPFFNRSVSLNCNEEYKTDISFDTSTMPRNLKRNRYPSTPSQVVFLRQLNETDTVSLKKRLSIKENKDNNESPPNNITPTENNEDVDKELSISS